MIETNIIRNNSNNEPPDQRDDTNDSRHVDEELTIEQKNVNLYKFIQVVDGKKKISMKYKR